MLVKYMLVFAFFLLIFELSVSARDSFSAEFKSRLDESISENEDNAWCEEIYQIIVQAIKDADKSEDYKNKIKEVKKESQKAIDAFRALQDRKVFEDAMIILVKNIAINSHLKSVLGAVALYFQEKKIQAKQNELIIWERRFSLVLGLIILSGSKESGSLAQEMIFLADRIGSLRMFYQNLLLEAQESKEQDPDASGDYDVFIQNFKTIVASYQEAERYYHLSAQRLEQAEKKHAQKFLRIEKFLVYGSACNVELATMLERQAKESSELAEQLLNTNF